MTNIEPDVEAYIRQLGRNETSPMLTGQEERDPRTLPFWANDEEARREYLRVVREYGDSDGA